MRAPITVLSLFLSGALSAALSASFEAYTTTVKMSPTHTDHAIGGNRVIKARASSTPFTYFIPDPASAHHCSSNASLSNHNAIGYHPPLVSDCQALAEKVKATGGGVYTLVNPNFPATSSLGEFPSIVSSGNCYFTIMGYAETQWIGSQDVVDLVTNSISWFATPNGTVAATGNTYHCQGYGGQVADHELGWALWGF